VFGVIGYDQGFEPSLPISEHQGVIYADIAPCRQTGYMKLRKS
jgi:hypothetical protein